MDRFVLARQPAAVTALLVLLVLVTASARAGGVIRGTSGRDVLRGNEAPN